MTGASLLAASILAGFLWDAFGAEWTLIAGAGLAILTITGLIHLRRKIDGTKGKRNASLAP